MRLRFAVMLALGVGLTACASGSGGLGGASRKGSPTRLTSVELETVANLDCFQAVQRLRAQWLRPRGGRTAEVMLDGNRQVGGLDALKNIPVSDVQEMRFINGRDATTRYGTGYDGGVIDVRTKR